MKSAKDFNNLMESKFKEIEDAIEEKEKKRQEAHRRFAESCINLLSESIKQLSDEAKHAYIKEVDPVLGFYRIGTNNQPGKSPSQVLLKDNKVIISLFYSEGAELNRPDHFDLDLINKLLEPYFVQVSVNNELNNGETMVSIEYDRNLKMVIAATDRIEEKEEAKKAEETKRRQEAAAKAEEERQAKAAEEASKSPYVSFFEKMLKQDSSSPKHGRF